MTKKHDELKERAQATRSLIVIFGVGGLALAVTIAYVVHEAPAALSEDAKPSWTTPTRRPRPATARTTAETQPSSSPDRADAGAR